MEDRVMTEVQELWFSWDSLLTHTSLNYQLPLDWKIWNYREDTAVQMRGTVFNWKTNLHLLEKTYCIDEWAWQASPTGSFLSTYWNIEIRLCTWFCLALKTLPRCTFRLSGSEYTFWGHAQGFAKPATPSNFWVLACSKWGWVDKVCFLWLLSHF